MERKEQQPPSGPPQAAEGEDDQLSEEKRAMVALARILGAGPLGGRSLRLLEQLADCVQYPQEETLREAEPAKRVAAQQTTSMEGGSTETAPAEVPTGEPSNNGDPEHNTEEGVIVGSLRTMPTDRWTCKVPSCTGKFHRLKDCRRFHKMEPEERLRLADLHGLCLGCLTPATAGPPGLALTRKSELMHARGQPVGDGTTSSCTWRSARPRRVLKGVLWCGRPARTKTRHPRRILGAKFSWSPSGSPPKGVHQL